MTTGNPSNPVDDDHLHGLTGDDLDRIRVQSYSMRPPQRERLLRLLLAYSARDAKFRELEAFRKSLTAECARYEERIADLEAFAREALSIGYGPGVDHDDLVCLHDEAKRLLAAR